MAQARIRKPEPPMREILLRPRAQLDLESIFLHIATALGAPKAARDTVDELYDAFERLAELPTIGMVFSSEDLDRAYRRFLVKNRWIYYTYDDQSLTIWRIFHARQDLPTQTLVEY